jgi:hypothetical protein
MSDLFAVAAASLLLLAPGSALADPEVVVAAPDLVAPVDRGSGPNLLLVNAGDLLDGVLSLEYERALAPWFGLSAGLSLWTFRGVLAPQTDPYFVAFGPQLGARFHPNRDAPGGLWLGPTVSVDYLASRSDGPLARAWSWGLGADIGYTFILNRSLSFQLGGGGRFIDYGDRVVWSPRLVIALGTAF